MPCMLGGSSFSAPSVIGTACFFAGQLSSPGPSWSRPLKVRCSCSESKRPLLMHSVKKALTNGSPFATVGSSRLYDSRIRDALGSSCGLRRVGSRSLFLPEPRELECPTPSVGLELSPKPCFHSGASGDFATVNLLELTGVSSDRLELVEEMPVEFVGCDDDGRLLVPPRVLRISPGDLTPPSAPGAATVQLEFQRSWS